MSDDASACQSAADVQAMDGAYFLCQGCADEGLKATTVHEFSEDSGYLVHFADDSDAPRCARCADYAIQFMDATHADAMTPTDWNDLSF